MPDEYRETMRQCDRLIAHAEGDAALQAFWLGVKRAYQADLSEQGECAAPTRLIALGEGPDIPVGRTPVVVGRDPRCDARLDSIRVSRIHCCLTEGDGQVVVQDLGSTNGILVNGRLVESGWLQVGDELSIAHLRYRVDNRRANGRTPAGFDDGLADRSGPASRPAVASSRPAGESRRMGQASRS